MYSLARQYYVKGQKQTVLQTALPPGLHRVVVQWNTSMQRQGMQRGGVGYINQTEECAWQFLRAPAPPLRRGTPHLVFPWDEDANLLKYFGDNKRGLQQSLEMAVRDYGCMDNWAHEDMEIDIEITYDVQSWRERMGRKHGLWARPRLWWADMTSWWRKPFIQIQMEQINRYTQ
jgi:hypothetical protein